MYGVREILVPVDFSEASRTALAHAAYIAERTKANLDVVHVWQTPAFAPPAESGFSSLSEHIEANAKQELDAFVQEARDRGIAIRSALLGSGIPSATILEIAERQRYDLIALGTHGRTGIAHTLLGSVAERVALRAPCPVLTVRERAPAPGVLRILVPVDYSEGSARALQYAAKLCIPFNAELDVIHVWDRPPSLTLADVIVHAPTGQRRSLTELMYENADLQMQQFLRSHSFQLGEARGRLPAHRLVSGEPAAALLSLLDRGQHDLVVVGTHGRTGLRHLLLGSIAEKLIRLSAVPVITVGGPHPSAMSESRAPAPSLSP